MHKDDQSPLGEEVTNLFLAIPVCDATNKNSARITAIILVLRLILLGLGETHVEWSTDTWEVLDVYNSAVSICSKLECCKCVWGLLLVSILLWNDVDLCYVAIPGKVVPYFRLSNING